MLTDGPSGHPRANRADEATRELDLVATAEIDAVDSAGVSEIDAVDSAVFAEMDEADGASAEAFERQHDNVAVATPEPGDSGPETDAGRATLSGWILRKLIEFGRPERTSTILGFGVSLVASIFVFVQLRPDLLFLDTTPTGGDMGAHVWGPAYMRDHLLPNGRLTGWTPDWYAGFPAYQYYMVVPALAIIATNAGINPFIGIPLGVAVIAFAVGAGRSFPAFKAAFVTAGVVGALLLVGMPYGIAFKLISVSGLVMFPLAAWTMGRLMRSPTPVPEFLAMAAVLFVFDTNFSIYGGNIASTLAGEFAFSISLTLTFVAIGLTARGMDHNNWRASSAVVIALVALCHIIPLFFAMAALVLLVLLDEKLPRSWALAAGITFALAPLTLADGTGLLVRVAAVGAFVVVVVAIMIAEPRVWQRAKWLLVAGPVASLLSAFWLVPFYLRSDFFNDMGWERLDEVQDALLTTPMKVALPVAGIGAILAFAIRDRAGMLFTMLAVAFAGAIANMPHGKLWNARLLPFYYLSVYILAAIALALVGRFIAATVSERLDSPSRPVMAGASILALLATLTAVGLPLRILPGADRTDGYSWFGIESNARSFVPSWVAWNYSGYERTNAYREYRDVVSTMTDIGEDVGCGRAMWEYNRELDSYGTPMALMLLPHWTDGCISSMEGLYFESSASTPFHFLNQSTLSEEPSRAQRQLPYEGFDIDVGIAQLQTVGVRYYMAQTDTAIAAAQDHPDLREVGVSEPFTVFEVAGSDLVVGLDVEPVVALGQSEEEAGELASRFEVEWISQALTFYNDPNGFDALPAEDGPEEWQRVSTQLANDGVPVEPATVSDVVIDNDRISFSVDEVGKPVYVKVSFFPNWNASGAEGPYRAGPNLMVVVPTENDVTLSYGYTGPEYLGYGLTFAALLALVGLSIVDHRRRSQASVAVAVGPAADGAVDETMFAETMFAETPRGEVSVAESQAVGEFDPDHTWVSPLPVEASPEEEAAFGPPDETGFGS